MYQGRKQQEYLKGDMMINKLFVYGIFLSERMRKGYGLGYAKYATVLDYATFGDYIVRAEPVPAKVGASLTGFIVDIPDGYNWERIDALERGYERRVVTTTDGEQAYMYTN